MRQNTTMIIAGLFGTLYILFGVIMAVSGLQPDVAGMTGAYGIPPDIIGGLVLCVVGAVYLSALQRLVKRTGSGYAYLYVAMALSVIFGTVALLSLSAQGADVVLFGDREPWDPVQLVVPMIYLAILPASCLYYWGRRFIGDPSGD